MLKKSWFGCSAAVVFGIAVLVMSILAVSDPVRIYPKETAQVLLPAKVEYYLPYPGILPDNPAYRLKALRDKIKLMFIVDMESKAKEELLLADKRIGAAVALVEGGKMNLGASTATKAEKYLGQSVDRIVALQRQGKDVKSMLLTLQKAIAKHVEVMDRLIGMADGTEKQVLEVTLKDTKQMGERVNQAWVESK